MTLYQNSAKAHRSKTIPPLQGLKKNVRSIQGAAPLATHYASSGLKPPDKFRREADKFEP